MMVRLLARPRRQIAIFLVIVGSSLYIYNQSGSLDNQKEQNYQDQLKSNEQISFTLTPARRQTVLVDENKEDLEVGNTVHVMVDHFQPEKLLPKNVDLMGNAERKRRRHFINRGEDVKDSDNMQTKTNKKQNINLCNISFDYGQMCPPLYTDLGGYCEINKKGSKGFDCPDIRRKGYNQLRSTQLVLTRLLKIFDLVAKKHGIKYWITSGTLLGAARHRGFIPWDEDADIEMTLTEYIKLFKCCKNEFPEGVFFQNSETDPYLKSWNETENHLQRHPVVGLYRRLWNPRLRDRKSCTKFCLVYDCDWVDGLMIDIFIAEDTMHPYHLKRIFPLKEMMFEGFSFPVPGNWKEILEYKYGDYSSELGESNVRIPEDDSDPFHSCEELKEAQNRQRETGLNKLEN